MRIEAGRTRQLPRQRVPMHPRSLSGFGGLALCLLTAGLRAQIVTFRLGEATASPGQAGVSVPLTVSVASAPEGGQPIAGLWATVRYDPAVLGAVRLESARESVYLDFRDQSLFVQPGMVGLSVLYSTSAEPREANVIEPGSSGVVAHLKFCLLASALAGTYPLKFVDGLRDSGGDPFARTRAKTPFGDV